jgi:hypothetical protein
MATGHWFTVKGALLVAQGQWDDAGAAAIKCGLVKVQPAAADTAAEVGDMNTVTDLLVTAGATECAFTNYVRKALTRTNAAEDDTNNRVNMVASNVVWSSAGGAANETVLGIFFYDATTDTNDDTRLLLSVDWFATGVTTNGSDLTYAPSTDLYRLAVA